MRLLNEPYHRAVRFLGMNGRRTDPLLLWQLQIMEQALHAAGESVTLWLTSATEGPHGAGSMHPWGDAVDFDLVPDPGSVAEWERLLTICRTVLGVEFQLFYEQKPDGSNSHAHLELDPG